MTYRPTTPPETDAAKSEFPSATVFWIETDARLPSVNKEHRGRRRPNPRVVFKHMLSKCEPACIPLLNGARPHKIATLRWTGPQAVAHLVQRVRRFGSLLGLMARRGPLGLVRLISRQAGCLLAAPSGPLQQG